MKTINKIPVEVVNVHYMPDFNLNTHCPNRYHYVIINGIANIL